VNMNIAILGGGCFWCLEAVFEEVRGVEKVISGYAGGQRPHPTYEQICTGATGHAEVVQLHFDPAVISFRQLLEVFFAIHDPTTPNRQGNDIGSQYRSVIFCQSDSQRLDAEAFIAELNIGKHYPSPIVTEVKGDTPFYAAEEYHQHYFARNPRQGYCQFVVAPKVLKFRNYFKNWQK
jgi:peptide-methionine (S)-S-oxide reductase